MAHRRFAAAGALLVSLLGAGAERSHSAANGALSPVVGIGGGIQADVNRWAPAARKKRDHFLPFAMMLLRWVNNVGGAAMQSDDAFIAQVFDQLDANKDGRLSEKELMSVVAKSSVDEQLMYKTIFIQSDIDDDLSLSLPEFEFMGFLANSDGVGKELDEIVRTVVPEFRKDLQEVFDGLRQEYPGRVRMRHFSDSLQRMLLHGYNEALDPGSIEILRALYDRADVIRDGTLNMNELDFFQFLVEDALVRTAADVYTVKGRFEGHGRDGWG